MASDYKDPYRFLLERAKVEYANGNFERAEQMLRQSLGHLGMDDELQECTSYLSEIYTQWGRYSDAIDINQEFINRTAARPGTNIDLIGASLKRVATINKQLGNNDQATEFTDMAERLIQGSLSPEAVIRQAGPRSHSRAQSPPRQISPGSAIRPTHDASPSSLPSNSPSPLPAAPALRKSKPAPIPPSAKPQAPEPENRAGSKRSGGAGTSVRPQHARRSSSGPEDLVLPEIDRPFAPNPYLDEPTPKKTEVVIPHYMGMEMDKLIELAQDLIEDPAELQEFNSQLQRFEAKADLTGLTQEEREQFYHQLNTVMKDSAGGGDYGQELRRMAAGKLKDAALTGSIKNEASHEAVSLPYSDENPGPRPQVELEDDMSGLPMPPGRLVAQPVKDAWSATEQEELESAWISPDEEPEWFSTERPSWNGSTASSPAKSSQGEAQPTPKRAAEAASEGEIFDASPSQSTAPSTSSRSSQSASSTKPHSDRSRSFAPDDAGAELEHSEPHSISSARSSTSRESRGVERERTEYARAPQEHESEASGRHSTRSSQGSNSQSPKSERGEGKGAGSASTGRSTQQLDGPSRGNLRSSMASSGSSPGVSLTPLIQFVHRIMATFQATSEYQPQNQQQTTNHNSTLYLMLLVVVIFCGSTAYNFLPRSTSPEQVFFTMPRKFKSADGEKRLALMDLKSSEVMAVRDRVKLDYRFFLDDFRDYIELSFGTVAQDQFWYYRTKNGIVDYQGGTLYTTDGAEDLICSTVERLAGAAKECYQRNGEYDEEIVVGELARYRNPFTRKTAIPTFERITVGEDKSAEEANNDRVRVYTNLLTEGKWPGEVKPQKGMIRCLAADFASPRGVSKAFLVQVVGGDCKPLNGSTLGVKYLYAQEDGKDYNEGFEKPQLPPNGWLRPQCIWIFPYKPHASLLVFAKATPYAVLFILLAIFVVPRIPLARLLRRRLVLLLLPVLAVELFAQRMGMI
ncbi:MAG: hypothetical protein K2Z81_07405 [Cyanobacteria bacterium]|nr:hypothetical protein [Cyanobacteriota bacterium]